MEKERAWTETRVSIGIHSGLYQPCDAEVRKFTKGKLKIVLDVQVGWLLGTTAMQQLPFRTTGG
jgi:hypothetical protein